MNAVNQNLSLNEAAIQFLASLSSNEGEASQQEVYKFVRWYGWERPFAGLKAPEVAKYVEWLSSSDTDYMKKLGLIRRFLTYAKKEGWSKINLATHLKAKKGKARLQHSDRHGLSLYPGPVSPYPYQTPPGLQCKLEVFHAVA